MPPLDALTQARIRSLEIVLAWLVGLFITYVKGRTDPQALVESIPEGFSKASSSPTYIMDLAEKISPEEEDV